MHFFNPHNSDPLDLRKAEINMNSFFLSVSSINLSSPVLIFQISFFNGKMSSSQTSSVLAHFIHFCCFFFSKKPIPYERTYWGTKQKNTKIKGKKKFILCFFKSFLCMHGTCDLCPQSGGIFYRLDFF